MVRLLQQWLHVSIPCFIIVEKWFQATQLKGFTLAWLYGFQSRLSTVDSRITLMQNIMTTKNVSELTHLMDEKIRERERKVPGENILPRLLSSRQTTSPVTHFFSETSPLSEAWEHFAQVSYNQRIKVVNPGTHHCYWDKMISTKHRVYLCALSLKILIKIP